MNPPQKVKGEEDVGGGDPVPCCFELEQNHLEPQLINLVSDDKEELVVLLAQSLL